MGALSGGCSLGGDIYKPILASKPVETDILQDLIRKSEMLLPGISLEGITDLLFSKSGFTPAVEEQAAIKKNIRLISVEDCLQ